MEGRLRVRLIESRSLFLDGSPLKYTGITNNPVKIFPSGVKSPTKPSTLRLNDTAGVYAQSPYT
jgi:hypothetical protein